VPEGKALYQYSQFCHEFDKWLSSSKATAHLKHVAGRVTYIDWAGDTLVLKCRVTGRDIKVYLFVACLPYSGYFYVEGFLDLTQRSWIAGHIHAFEYFGGVSQILTPDNCATATDRTPIYVTQINSTYSEFAEHYQTAVIPTRVRRPTDKALVEFAVGLSQRWIIAPLRNQTFFSLDELQEIIAEKNEELNAQPFQVKEGSRASVFFEEEKSELKELPLTRYELAEWKTAKVAHDYHVQIDYMRYSVDYRLIKERVEVRVSDTKIDIYSKSRELIASHRRLFGRKGQFSTLTEHMPPNHIHADSSYSPERFRRWATAIGSATIEVIEGVLASKAIVEQTFVSCANILGLAKKHNADLLEAASTRMLELGGPVSYTRMKNTMAAIKEAVPVEPIPNIGIADSAPDIGRTRTSEYYRRQRGGKDAD
jgi:transposase